MRCEVITIGTELLLGDTVNTNAAWISKRLALYGVNLYQQRTVGDNKQRLVALLKSSLEENDLLITTGGLGPTIDDITRESVAEALGVALITDEDSLKEIESFYIKRKRVMTPNNARQAQFPEGARVLANGMGTAPGCIVEHKKGTVIMLPGPPHEMEHVFGKHVEPYLEKMTGRVISSRTVRICGIGEGEMESRVEDIISNSSNPSVAPYAKTGECMLRITALAPTESEAKLRIKPLEEAILERIGEFVYGFDEDTLETKAVSLLKEKNYTIACAESCTGGMLTSRLVSVPGVSSRLLCSLVTYTNQSKISELSVKPETLNLHGAVSEETAREMASGVRLKFAADVGVGVTGIAGPDGGSEEKPVGLVFAAIDIRGKVSVFRMELPGNRDFVRMRAVNSVLYRLITLLRDEIR